MKCEFQSTGVQNVISHILEFSIQQADVTTFDADVIALKYAQAFYGTDKLIAEQLQEATVLALDDLRVPVNRHRYVSTQDVIVARKALFVGVPNLEQLRYSHIRHFASKVLEILSSENEGICHLAMTVHGTARAVALDPAAAFLAQYAGYMDALRQNQFPKSLLGISIIDRNPDRIQYLRLILEQRLAGESYASSTATSAAYHLAIAT